jgi:hypothetical protein
MEQKLYEVIIMLMRRLLNPHSREEALKDIVIAQEAINMYEDSKLKEEQNDN